MCRKLIFLFAVLGFCFSPTAQALTIVWVSEWMVDPVTTNPYDWGWITLLRNQGYTVLADTAGNYSTLDTAKLATLENADLIIVSRTTNSAGYATDTTEVTQWNSVKTPLMLLTGYIVRSNRWVWMNITTFTEFATEAMLQVVDGSHPIFTGITPVSGQVDMIDGTVNSGQMSFTTATEVGNGKLIAKRAGDNVVWIAEWAAGTPFYSGSSQTPADKRMLFSAGGGGAQTAGSINFTPDGRTMFLNAVAYMLGQSTEPGRASNPRPDDKATDIARDVVLKWNPGKYAAKHNVYFGTSSADVNTATPTNHPNVEVSLNQDANSYDPAGLLTLGLTYYWRVDEVNAPPTSSTIFTGPIWNFTVETPAYRITGTITATASSYIPNMEPIKTIDGSGINTANDQHGTTDTTMWLSDTTPQPTWIKYEFDKVYKLHEMWVWNSNQAIESSIGLGIKSVKVEYSINGANWTQLNSISEFAPAPGTANCVHQTLNLGGVSARYVRITALSNWKGIVQQYGLSEVRFFYIPVQAREPNPTNGQTNVALDTLLRWRAGREAAAHKLYFSTNRQAVLDGIVAPIDVPATGSYASYGPMSLDLATTYYWKVNEVNNTTTTQGDVWSFSTVAYLTVDNFESYNNNSPNRIFQTWLDGVGYSADEFFPVAYNGNGSGAAVGHDIWTPGTTYTNIMERTIIHSGAQSMPLYYNNTKTPFYSETERTLAASQNWTLAGARTLTLYFYGDPNNNINEPMWVRLTDQSGNSKKITYGKYADEDVNALKATVWREWNIALTDFGINTSQVKKIAIGFSETGGASPRSSGKVYIDDIRLYPARCLASRTKPTGDLNNDCTVDYNDIDILANAWLMTDQVVTTTAPAATNLIGYWKLDDATGGIASDSSGSSLSCTLNGTPQWVTGYIGGALEFNGTTDYAMTSTFSNFNSDRATMTAWIKRNGDQTGWAGLIFHRATVVCGIGFSGLAGATNQLQYTWNNNNAATYNWVSGLTVPNNEWVFVALTIEPTKATLYLNNKTATNAIAHVAQAITDINLGRDTQTGRFFRGVIDDARVYSRTLSLAEIAYLADTTPGDGQFYYPVQSPAELYSAESAGSRKVNFKDFAVLAATWLEEKLWP